MSGDSAYQDEAWEELIDGRLVAMSPRPVINHNRVAFRIAHLFESYLEGRACTALSDGVELYLTEKDRFIPDMMIVCDRSKLHTDGVHGAPDLVVEVLSPGTAKRDRTCKKDVYAKCGARGYWLANPSDKSVEVYLPKGGDLALQEVYSIYPEGLLKKMTEEERAAVVTRFKCSLYDDFEIALEDIFQGDGPVALSRTAAPPPGPSGGGAVRPCLKNIKTPKRRSFFRQREMSRRRGLCSRKTRFFQSPSPETL